MLDRGLISQSIANCRLAEAKSALFLVAVGKRVGLCSGKCVDIEDLVVMKCVIAEDVETLKNAVEFNREGTI